MDLKEILEKHKKWLRGDDGGERADLSRADLYGANLSGAKNVNDVIWSLYTVFYPLQCPEFGAYTAYKKSARADCRAGNTGRRKEVVGDLQKMPGKQNADHQHYGYQRQSCWRAGGERP